MHQYTTLAGSSDETLHPLHPLHRCIWNGLPQSRAEQRRRLIGFWSAAATRNCPQGKGKIRDGRARRPHRGRYKQAAMVCGTTGREGNRGVISPVVRHEQENRNKGSSRAGWYSVATVSLSRKPGDKQPDTHSQWRRSARRRSGPGQAEQISSWLSGHHAVNEWRPGHCAQRWNPAWPGSWQSPRRCMVM